MFRVERPAPEIARRGHDEGDADASACSKTLFAFIDPKQHTSLTLEKLPKTGKSLQQQRSSSSASEQPGLFPQL